MSLTSSIHPSTVCLIQSPVITASYFEAHFEVRSIMAFMPIAIDLREAYFRAAHWKRSVEIISIRNASNAPEESVRSGTMGCDECVCVCVCVCVWGGVQDEGQRAVVPGARSALTSRAVSQVRRGNRRRLFGGVTSKGVQIFRLSLQIRLLPMRSYSNRWNKRGDTHVEVGGGGCRSNLGGQMAPTYGPVRGKINK